MIDFMKSITNKSGQAFYNIGKERLSTALLPIPSLAEQHRIVAQIEKLFRATAQIVYSIWATMRCCSAKDGIGNNAVDKRSLPML